MTVVAVETLRGPALADVVTIVVPDREHVRACVHDAAAGWIDVTLLSAPQTPWGRLSARQVSLQFAGAEGLCRIVGHLAHRPQDARLRVVGYGSGETLRFEHRGQVQLLRRSALVSAQANLRIVVLRSDAPDHVAIEARCVGVGGAGLRLARVPFAARGQRYEFDLFLDAQEPAVSGELHVDRVGVDTFLETTFTMITAHDRSRIVHWAADHGSIRVA